MIDLIGKECSNYILYELKLILIYGILMCLLFYFTDRDYIIYFCISFLVGILVSVFIAYEVTMRSVLKLQTVLDKSRYIFNYIELI
jgi:hypothetical protein